MFIAPLHSVPYVLSMEVIMLSLFMSFVVIFCGIILIVVCSFLLVLVCFSCVVVVRIHLVSSRNIECLICVV